VNDSPAPSATGRSAFANWTAAFSATAASDPFVDDIERACHRRRGIRPPTTRPVGGRPGVSAVLANYFHIADNV